MKKLVREVGPWVDKERFWNREQEFTDLIELLDEGANILITAPRRIGKTSLIGEAGNRLESRCCCLQLDLQKSHSPADVITDGCLQALANNYEINFSKGAKEKMIDLIGSCIPHHVQMFFNYVYFDCKKRNNMNCTEKDAVDVYNTRMLSTRGNAELSTYEERLRMVLSSETLPLALELLTEAAVTGKLTPEAAKILSRDFLPMKKILEKL